MAFKRGKDRKFTRKQIGRQGRRKPWHQMLMPVVVLAPQSIPVRLDPSRRR